MLVLVTGAHGQLGSAVVRGLSRHADVAAFSHRGLDVTDAPAVLGLASRLRPDVIVNAAVAAGVDRAEDEPLEALRVNAFAVRTLAEAARQNGARLVHFSTDFVFDGTSGAPYVEEDRPNPLGVYGASKLLGEWMAPDAPRSLVLRVESLFGGPGGKSSVDRILSDLAAGRTTPVFTDRTVSPSYVEDVVDALRALLAVDAPAGLYHVVNSGYTTWEGLAAEAARLLGREGLLTPVRMEDVPLRAARPRFCALSNARLAGVGIVMPSWQDALSRALAARGGLSGT